MPDTIQQKRLRKTQTIPGLEGRQQNTRNTIRIKKLYMLKSQEGLKYQK